MKKVLIGVAAVLVVIVGGLIYVFSSLDSIVKDAIQTYGSQATKTTVSVDSVKITLKSGEGAIAGLNVGNAKGFTDPNIFQLGLISTKIDTSTVTENPVVIDELVIRDPAVFYEINSAGLSNIDALKKNLGLSGKQGSTAEEKEESGEAVKMIIRKLVVEGGKAKVLIAALGGKEQTVTLPAIRLTDIGKKSGGATAMEVAQILSNAMLKNVKGSVAKIGVNQYLGKSADAFKKGAMDKIGGTTGGSPADMGGALKGLLGK
ncbi:MAG TPA: hypothetical protein VKA31_06860 [Mariprofundaceae bacterium]|nr:hypothetical protein [Mariprofundaceae bacterium]